MTNCNRSHRFTPNPVAAALFLSAVLLLTGCRKAPNTDIPPVTQSVTDPTRETNAADLTTPTFPEETIAAGEQTDTATQPATEVPAQTETVPVGTTTPPDETFTEEEPNTTIPSATQPATEAPVETEPVSIETTAPPEETLPAVPTLEFPLYQENDRLLLEPPFSYDGLNPDCGYAEGTGIAAITVTNCSDRHLDQAEFTLILADGTGIPFRIEHIPAGKKVTAFALDNSVVPEGAQWTGIQSFAQFAQQDCLRFHGLSVQEIGTDITLSNTTGSDMTDVTIYCHDLLGDVYFGGKTYSYKVNNIPAGGNTSVEALDSVLGIAEVSYAAGNHE